MSSMAPRGENETDAEYKARQVALGKFNARMYGERQAELDAMIPKAPERPTMPVAPVLPDAPIRDDTTIPAPLPTGKKVKPKTARIAKTKVTPKSPPTGSAPGRPEGQPDARVVPALSAQKAPSTVVAPAAKLAAPPVSKMPIGRKAMSAKDILTRKAAGGAAKVRKDMMSPEGKILHAMNKIRGK